MKGVVGIGELVTGSGEDVFKVLGVGSCVIVCLYDEEVKAGGMAHILLASSNGLPYKVSNPNKIGEFAIPALINELRTRYGAKKIVAKIVGGASLFQDSKLKIGYNNILGVKEILERYSIPVVGEDVGGNEGRKVKFYPGKGVVEVIRASGKEVVI